MLTEYWLPKLAVPAKDNLISVSVGCTPPVSVAVNLTEPPFSENEPVVGLSVTVGVFVGVDGRIVTVAWPAATESAGSFETRVPRVGVASSTRNATSWLSVGLLIGIAIVSTVCPDQR